MINSGLQIRRDFNGFIVQMTYMGTEHAEYSEGNIEYEVLLETDNKMIYLDDDVKYYILEQFEETEKFKDALNKIWMIMNLN